MRISPWNNYLREVKQDIGNSFLTMLFKRFQPINANTSLIFSFMGNKASTQWITEPRRSIPLNQVIWRFAN